MTRSAAAAALALALAGAASASEPAVARGTPSRARALARPAPSFEELSRRATEAREANQAARAVELYERALRLKPAWSEGLWYLGTLQYEESRWGPAADAFRRFVDSQPRNGAAWVLLGLCEFRLGAHRQAFRDIDHGKSFGGLNPEIKTAADYHLGIIFTKFGQYEAAVEVLSALASLSPESPELSQALGTAILRLPFLPAELPEEKKALVMAAGAAGYAHAQHRWDEAQRLFREIVAGHPDLPNIHYAYGAFLNATDTEAALAEFRREIEISPGHVPARLQIALEYLRRGEGATGLPFAEEAVKLAPAFPPARYVLGRLLLLGGQTERAVAELQEAARLDAENPQVHFALSQAYASAGRAEDARRAHEAFVRLEKLQRARMDRLPVAAPAAPAPSAAP